MRNRAVALSCLALSLLAAPALGQPVAAWRPRAAAAEREQALAIVQEVQELDARLQSAPPAERYQGFEADLATRRRFTLQRLTELVPALVDLVASPGIDPRRREVVEEALASLGATEETRALLPVAKALGVQTPAHVLDRLGALAGVEGNQGAEGAEEQLIALLRVTRQDPTSSQTQQLMIALAQGGGRRTIGELADMLLAGESVPAALETLEGIARRDEGYAVVQELQRRLEAGEVAPGPLEAAHILLGRIAHPSAMAYLTPWVREAAGEFRRRAQEERGELPRPFGAALMAMGQIGDAEAVQMLADTYTWAQDAPIRAGAARAMAELKPERARDAGLIEQMVDWLGENEAGAHGPPDRAVRDALVGSLRKLTGANLGDRHAMWKAYIDRQRARDGR